MAQDVLGFGTKSSGGGRGGRGSTAPVIYSKGTQKNIDAIRKNAGKLSDTIGEGADDSYKQFAAQQLQKHQAQKQQSQPDKPQPQPKQSFLTKVKNAGKDIVTGVAHDAEKAANTGAVVVGGTIGLSQAAFDAAHGNKKAAQSTAAKTNKNMTALEDHGLGNQGALLTSKQANSSGGGIKSVEKNFLKPVAKGAAEYGQYAIPLGKAAKGASVLERIVKPAAQNAVVGAGGTAANEKLDTGHVNLKDVAKGAAAGAALGAGGQVLHEGFHVSKTAGNAPDVTTKAANDVMSKVRTPNSVIQEVKNQSLLKAAEDKKTAAASVESDKAVQQSKKLDQQIELVNAKKADGKFTNVDRVKVAQLKAQKEDLAPKIINHADETPTKPAAPVSESVVPAQKIQPVETSKSMGSESSTASVAPTEGSLLSKVTTKPARDSAVIPAATRSLKPSETAHMPEIGGYTHSEHMAQDYADMLRGQEQVAKGGQMVKNADGSYKRISEHSRFFRDVYKETGRAPTKADYLEQAKKELENGKDQMGGGDVYKQLLEREGKPVPRVKVESTVKDVPQGTSKVAQRIAADIKSQFGEQYKDGAKYDRLTIADQAKKAEALINNREELDKVISGEKPLPDGLRATSVITAVRNSPELLKDPDLLKRLASSPLASESSLSAQELRLARENAAHDPISGINSVKTAREDAYKGRTGETATKAVSREAQKIRANVPKTTVTKETWGSFIDSLKCS